MYVLSPKITPGRTDKMLLKKFTSMLTKVIICAIVEKMLSKLLLKIEEQEVNF
jgi:hypothetical protein